MSDTGKLLRQVHILRGGKVEKKVYENIVNNNLIKKGDTIILGVSGGPDSMALLYSLNKIKGSLGFDIIVAHLNHGTRGLESDRDQEFVEKISQELKLEYFKKKVAMVDYAKKNKLSEEEAGRKLRYDFFKDISKNYPNSKIAVAHNLNDQSETLLMRIIRGTGIDGLKGIEMKTNQIIRPLLNIKREEIEEYISHNNIKTVLDHTNLLPMYTRNKIRLELIPYIEENFNKNIVDALWRLSKIADMENDFIEELVEENYKIMLKSREIECIILDGVLFKDKHICLQTRIIRRAISDLLGSNQGYGEEHINLLLNLFIEGKTGKKIDLPHNIIGYIDYDSLVIKIGKEEEVKGYKHKLSIGCNYIPEIGISLKLDLLDNIGELRESKYTKFYDYDQVIGDIYLRSRETGDRFSPYGMKGSKKLKDIFINDKISREDRDNIPLLSDEKNILWIVGYRNSSFYKVEDSTKKILKVEIIKII